MKTIERFSDRVQDYVAYRPRYPAEIIPFLIKEIGLSPAWVIADIGSGTGFSSEMFLKNGNQLFGVEPNADMRAAAESLLNSYQGFHSIAGSAEATSLADQSIDLVVAGQAFHWFDVPKASSEFRRILKHGGYCVLIWNERETDSSEFLRAYEELLNTFGTDYSEVNHANSYGRIGELFGENGYEVGEYPNEQVFDYTGLEGRLLSSSYTPASGDPQRERMLKRLREIFDEFAVEGKVRILYRTKLYYGRLPKPQN